MNRTAKILKVAEMPPYLLYTTSLTELQQGNILGNPIALAYTIRTTVSILAVIAIIIILLFVGGVCLSKTRLFRSMALFTIQDKHQGYTAQTYPNSLIGLEGIAQTPLRPSGKAMIRGTCYDVKALGTYVMPGVAVVVTSVTGNTLIVQAIPSPEMR